MISRANWAIRSSGASAAPSALIVTAPLVAAGEYSVTLEVNGDKVTKKLKVAAEE